MRPLLDTRPRFRYSKSMVTEAHFEELATAADIARYLGYSRPRIHQLMKEDPMFPAPLGVLGGRKIFRWGDVVAWANVRNAA